MEVKALILNNEVLGYRVYDEKTTYDVPRSMFSRNIVEGTLEYFLSTGLYYELEELEPNVFYPLTDEVKQAILEAVNEKRGTTSVNEVEFREAPKQSREVTSHSRELSDSLVNNVYSRDENHTIKHADMFIKSVEEHSREDKSHSREVDNHFKESTTQFRELLIDEALSQFREDKTQFRVTIPLSEKETVKGNSFVKVIKSVTDIGALSCNYSNDVYSFVNKAFVLYSIQVLLTGEIKLSGNTYVGTEEAKSSAISFGFLSKEDNICVPYLSSGIYSKEFFEQFLVGLSTYKNSNSVPVFEEQEDGTKTYHVYEEYVREKRPYYATLQEIIAGIVYILDDDSDTELNQSRNPTVRIIDLTNKG